MRDFFDIAVRRGVTGRWVEGDSDMSSLVRATVDSLGTICEVMLSVGMCTEISGIDGARERLGIW